MTYTMNPVQKHLNLALFFFFSILLVSVISKSYKLDCSIYMRSTCPNDIVSNWNKENVGESLRSWIKSIKFEKLDENSNASRKIHGLEHIGNHCIDFVATDDEPYFARVREDFSVTSVTFGKITLVDDVRNSEAHERKFVGPVWTTIHYPFEWEHDYREGPISVLSEDASFHNGLYYRASNNANPENGNHY